MADEMDNIENLSEDDGQISEDDWAAAMAEQAITDAPAAAVDYAHLEVPSVVRRGQRNVTVEALANSGVDRYDIPAFLRKQAD